MSKAPGQLALRQRSIKRAFDIVFSFVGLGLVSPIIAVAWVSATFSTGKNGFFVQQRIGRFGKPFPLFKLRTMREIDNLDSTVTTLNDPRITRVGAFLRKTKIDELPQLANVLLGHMSMVGPRPDVAGFADELTGEDRVILQLRPGITGPASVQFRNEEELLAQQANPDQYNREVIWPSKVQLNKEYIRDYGFFRDLAYIFRTLFVRRASTRSDSEVNRKRATGERQK